MSPAPRDGVQLRLAALNERILACRRCPRLAQYIRAVARRKVRRYRDWEYWGRPLPGFGDPLGRLLILGLAPAAHGGNRTGRMFAGDRSGDWLIRALYETGFANQPLSVHRDDGLELHDAYITASLRCAPPANKPTPEERDNCGSYLREELHILPNVKIVVALGRFAYDNYLRLYYPALRPRPPFEHGRAWQLQPTAPVLVASYHPSQQNTQTKRLTWPQWMRVFQQVRQLLHGQGRTEWVQSWDGGVERILRGDGARAWRILEPMPSLIDCSR